MHAIWLFSALAFASEAPSAPAMGRLAPPSYDLRPNLDSSREPYVPGPGDVVFIYYPSIRWMLAEAIAFTGEPGHCGVVAPMPDGRLGVFEAGGEGKIVMSLLPLPDRLADTPRVSFVRRRKTPATATETALLAEFAEKGLSKRFSCFRLALNVTPFRPRGPLRTSFLGKPRGLEADGYFCSEAVLEALTYAGMIDAATVRPAASFPRDLFFDRCLNPHIRKYPPLRDGWEMPQRWFPGE